MHKSDFLENYTVNVQVKPSRGALLSNGRLNTAFASQRTVFYTMIHLSRSGQCP
jgi:hypothetical protein